MTFHISNTFSQLVASVLASRSLDFFTGLNHDTSGLYSYHMLAVSIVNRIKMAIEKSSYKDKAKPSTNRFHTRTQTIHQESNHHHLPVYPTMATCLFHMIPPISLTSCRSPTSCPGYYHPILSAPAFLSRWLVFLLAPYHLSQLC